jgi:predicted aspartyl protease
VILGVVDKKGVPCIDVAIAGKFYRATINTGFNGDVELPDSLRPLVNPRWIFEAESMLAAGIPVSEDVYAVEFPWDGKMVDAEATFADVDEILIGTHLLRDYRLSIDFVARTVRAERLR